MFIGVQMTLVLNLVKDVRLQKESVGKTKKQDMLTLVKSREIIHILLMRNAKNPLDAKERWLYPVSLCKFMNKGTWRSHVEWRMSITAEDDAYDTYCSGHLLHHSCIAA